MLKWFSTREVDEFAKTLAAELAKRIPPAGVDPSDKKALKKLVRMQNSVFDQIERFAQQRVLNLYQKASFGNTFKWSLKEAGYAEPAVDAWTQELVTYLTLKSRKKG